MGNVEIAWKNSFRYLGVILDQKLTWENHINSIISKVEKSLNLLKAVTRRHWGADPKTSLMFYRAYVRTLIDFGSIFYGSATKTRLLKIDRLQYKAVRIITGALSSTPTNALLAETGELPLSLRRLHLAEKFIIKNIFTQNDFLVNKINKVSLDNLTNSYWVHKNSPPLADAFIETAKFQEEIVKSPKLPFFTGNFDSIFFNIDISFSQYSESPKMNNNIIDNIKNDLQDATSVYTDGSKSPEGVGCAFYIRDIKYGESFRINSNSSIFSAEAYAIIQALDYIISNKTASHVLIFSDSMSCLQAISNKTKHLYKNPLIFDIFQKLIILARYNIRVSFFWAKGHAGIKGNEQVDMLAKQAITKDITIPGLQYYDAISYLKQEAKNKWRVQYAEYAVNNQNFYTRTNRHLVSNPSIQETNLNRCHYTTFIRLTFGHGNFRYLLNKMNLADSPLCTCDSLSVDDLNHWLFSCLNNQRASCFLLEKLAELDKLPINACNLMTLAKQDKKINNLLIRFVRMVERKLKETEYPMSYPMCFILSYRLVHFFVCLV